VSISSTPRSARRRRFAESVESVEVLSPVLPSRTLYKALSGSRGFCPHSRKLARRDRTDSGGESSMRCGFGP